jgi:hypothetical protein
MKLLLDQDVYELTARFLLDLGHEDGKIYLGLESDRFFEDALRHPDTRSGSGMIDREIARTVWAGLNGKSDLQSADVKI